MFFEVSFWKDGVGSSSTAGNNLNSMSVKESEMIEQTDHGMYHKRTISLILLAILGIGLSIAGFIADSSGAILIGLCLILGLDVKLTDQLIDDRSMSRYRFLIFPFALLVPILMGYLAMAHDPVFGMVIGTAIGLLLSGKLDHIAYIVSAIGFIAVMVAFIVLLNVDIAMTSIYIIPVACIGAFGDEFGHEKVSQRETHKAITFFFQHRFFLKALSALCVVLSWARIIHFIGFLCFDLSYDVVAASWNSGKKIR